MGFRFRKSINLGGGFRVNLSKSGVGYSWGTKGARFTKTAKGTSRTTVGIPGTGFSYVTETSNSKTRKAQKKTTCGSQALTVSTSTTWTDFVLCLLFGILGVHKFRENRVGLGLVYLFTGGLFGIGWMVDCIKYLIGAIKTSVAQGKPDSNHVAIVTESTKQELQENSGKMGKKRKIWPLVALVALSLIVLVSACGAPQDNGSDSVADVPAVTEETKHEHDFIAATCKAPKTCSSCGETEGDPGEHLWAEANCAVPQTCSACGETQGELGNHMWVDATCAVPKTCAVCSATEGDLAEHTWVEATCTAPKTCTVCNITDGEPVEHSWQDATCVALKTCTVCDTTTGEYAEHDWKKATCEAPKTCKVCGTQEGELGDHKWKKATCESPKTCKTCGETIGSLKDHTYKNGKCTGCGTSEPTVWIPKTGSKYHSDKSCSRMKNPKKVTISKAKKMGYEPCSKC